MMTDPISDMLTRVRNALAVGKLEVKMPASKIKSAIAQVLKDEGYISNFSVDDTVKKTLTITLKYYQGKPVISMLKRVSKPGLRIYRNKGELPTVLAGLGIAIISTSTGLLTDASARSAGCGGEVLCYIS